MGGCISSDPSVGYAQRNMEASNENYILQNPIFKILRNPMDVHSNCETDEDNHKMSLFIKKYKLEPLASSIYNERITIDFLFSQHTHSITLIAQQLTNNNIIQQNKFIYAVATEKSLSNKTESTDSSLSIQFQDSFRIFINYSFNDEDSLKLPLYVYYTQTILNILIEFRNKYKLNKVHNTQTLMYCGTKMKHNEYLSYYGVLPDSVLYISSNYKYKMKMNIFINVERHKQCVMSVMVLQETKIKKLKQEIERKWGISIRNQRLNYNNKELLDGDGQCIQDYEIHDNDNLYLTKKLGLYSVFISVCYENKSIAMDIEKCDTIKRIKMQIQLYLNVPFSEQRLMYLGEELVDNEATIKSTKLIDGAVLHLESN